MQDTSITTTAAPTRFQCRHIHADGRQCGSVSLRNENFCYFHHSTRVPIRNARERKGRRSTFDLPLIEDRASILRAISEIITRISTNEVDPRRAGLLLYGLQIAVISLPKEPAITESTPIQPTVEDITIDPEQGPLAPQIEFSNRTRTGKQPKDLEQILMEDWARDEEYHRRQADAQTQAEAPIFPWNEDPGDSNDAPVPRIQALADQTSSPTPYALNIGLAATASSPHNPPTITKMLPSPKPCPANPSIGGPTSSPAYPIPTAVASPTPDAIPGTRPAARYSTGDEFATPSPSTLNPTIAIGSPRPSSTIATPAAPSAPPTCSAAVSPSLATTVSPVIRPTSIAAENAANPYPTTPAPSPRTSRRNTALQSAIAPSQIIAANTSAPRASSLAFGLPAFASSFTASVSFGSSHPRTPSVITASTPAVTATSPPA